MTNDDWKMEWEKYKALVEAKEAIEDIADTPTHYDRTIQPWDYMESIFNDDEFQGYLVGNIIKYVSRYKDKGGVMDIKKAQHYIEKLLTVL